MQGYEKLVRALRNNDWSDACPCCDEAMCKDADCIILQAADAIEALQATIELMKPYMPDFFPDANKMVLPKLEPKRGEWRPIYYDNKPLLVECSNCGAQRMGEVPYCPFCGAKMREVQE